MSGLEIFGVVFWGALILFILAILLKQDPFMTIFTILLVIATIGVISLVCGHAEEICLSPSDAARLTLAYEKGELCKAEVSEWEQYSTNKEAQLADVQRLADVYRVQVEKDVDTINQLKVLALRPEPKFKILLDPFLYLEGRVMGTGDIARAGIGVDILRWKGLFIYGKVEGAIQEVSTKQQGNFGIYGGMRWYPFK